MSPSLSFSRAWLAAVTSTVIFLGASQYAPAQIHGAIIKANGQRVPSQGQAPIRWLPSKKQYLVTLPSGVAVPIALQQVRALDVPKPPNLEAAAQLSVRSPASAIPTLERIVKDYTMLKWDTEAARWLAEAYLRMNKPKEAVEYLERLSPETLREGSLSRAYWSALQQSGQKAKLKRVLLEAIENGPRETAAIAQVIRGDLEMEAGNIKEALVHNYLRTVLLFDDVKSIQPEALIKAMRAHEKLGEHSHAEKWKRKLLQDYPDSPYSKELKGSG